MNFLIHLDQSLFEMLNSFHSTFWDEVMWVLSSKTAWIPAYFLLLFWIWKKENWQSILLVLVSVGIMILMADQLASGFLKPWIGRYRPCRPEANLDFAVHIVNQKCGGKYGFVSSHAANFFALATFFSLYFKNKKITILLLFLASLVAYSRVYLGVHYPGDVLGGAVLGSVCAVIAWKFRTCYCFTNSR